MKILLDCDPGHDDAIALLLALASPEVELLGITTVPGNQTLEKTTVNALSCSSSSAARTSRSPPAPTGRSCASRSSPRTSTARAGSTGPTLPPPTTSPTRRHAVDFIADTIRGSAGPVTLVPTGPLTNIGLFLNVHPDAAEKVERIVLMGGAIGEGNVTPAAEFNIWVRPGGGAARLPERARRDDDRPRRHAPGDLRPRADRRS